MGVASELAVKFTADTSGLEAGGQKAEGLIGRMTTGLGKLGLAGLGVGVIKGAVSGVVGSMGDLIGAAEGTSDAYARLDEVLGGGRMETVAEAAKANANALGLSKQAYLETAGATATMLSATGLGADAITKMSTNLTELAPKFAALNNATTESVNSAFQDAMKGRVKGLAELGVAIDENAISKMSDAAKAQYIYQQIQEKGVEVSKTWEGNQGDVANSMARVKASMDDAKAAIGEGLLPLIAPLAERFAGLASTLAGAVGPAVKSIMEAFRAGGLDAAVMAFGQLAGINLGPVVDVIQLVGSAVSSMAHAWQSARDDAMGPFSSAVAAIGGALEGLGLETVSATVLSFSGAMSQAWNVITGAQEAVKSYNPQVQAMGDMMVGAYNAAMSLWAGIQPLIDVIAAAGAKFVEFAGGPGRLMQTVLGTALVAAFGALAIAAGSAAVSIIAALAPVLIPIAAIVAAVVVLRKAWDTNFGGIREKTAAVIGWITANVGPAISGAFEVVKTVLGAMAEWWDANGKAVIAIIRGVWDVIAGVFTAAFSLIRGVVMTAINLIRGDFEGAGKSWMNMWIGMGAGILRVVKGAFLAIVNAIALIGSQIVLAAVKIGTAIIEGIVSGLSNAQRAVFEFLTGMAKAAIAAVKKVFGIASPSKVFAEMGEQIVAGLRVGLEGIALIGAIIQDGLAKAIGAMDVENFEMIHRLTSAILGIFKDAAEGIRSLLSFDIVTTADQIGAAFNRLVGVFQTAIGKMAELSKAAGQGTKPGNEGFINMDHIANIERYTGAIEATLGVASGTLDILEKLAKVAMPGAGAITALIPFLQEVANAAAVFEQPLGKDEDAIAVFERGAIVAGHMATFAKNVADLAALKFGAITETFAAEVKAAAAAAGQAWDAVKDAAEFWGDMPSLARDKLIVGVKAYAEAVGAALSILKGAGDLNLSEAVFATAEQMGKANTAAADALSKIAGSAKWWIENAEKAAEVVAGIKLYAEAVGAAVSMLGAAGGLALDTAVFATDVQLAKAADVAAKAYGELLRVIGKFADMGEEMPAFVAIVKGYAEATSAAAGMLGAAGALDFTKAVFATDEQLAAAADVAARALAELERVIGDFAKLGEKMPAFVAMVKGFADAAGAALDLLGKGADGINKLGEIDKLAGVQPRLIRAVLSQLAYIVDLVAANVPTIAPETVERLKGLGDLAGVFDPLVKAAAGINALGDVKRLAGVQPRLIRAILGGVSMAVAELAKGAQDFGADVVTRVKAWGEASSATLGALNTAADGLNKMSGKLSIPEDLAGRVGQLVGAMRIIIGGMAEALSGDGAISLDVAKAGADIAEAVGRIGEAFGPIFDAINAAIASPFGKIKAGGQRGDTFRQNIANRVKASLVAAVTAISDALASMPAIVVPDGLELQIDRLASVYERILDVVERLGEVTIDTRTLTALAGALAILTGGVSGVGGGDIKVSGGGSSLSVQSGPGGGIVINNTFAPVLTPLPITIQTTNNIVVGDRVVEAISVEVKELQDLELRQTT